MAQTISINVFSTTSSHVKLNEDLFVFFCILVVLFIRTGDMVRIYVYKFKVLRINIVVHIVFIIILIAIENTIHFVKNPIKGGIPPSIDIKNSIVSFPLRFFSISLTSFVFLFVVINRNKITTIQ